MGLGGHVSKADHVWADTVCRGEAEAGARAGEIGLAPAEDDGVEVDPVFVNETKLREAVGKLRTGDFHITIQPVFEVSHRGFQIIRNECGARAD